MTLPINMSGVVWFAPRALWAWEADPTPPPPPPAESAPSCSATEPAGATAARADAAPEGPRRLVFKGYAYDTRVNWVFADGPLIRPWQADELDESLRRRRTAPAAPAAAADPPAPTGEPPVIT